MRKFLWCCLLGTGFIYAGLTDFKMIAEAKKAYEAKDFNKSVSFLNKLENDTPQKYYDAGNALYKDKKYKQAIEAYEKSKGVDEATRLHNLGNSYFQTKKLDKAIESYEKALKLKEDAQTKFNLELAKKQKKKNEQKKKKQDKKEKKNNKDKKNQDKKQEDKKKGDKKKEQDKKSDKKKKKSDEKKSGDKKEDAQKKPSKAEQAKMKKEKIKAQDLKRLMKKMGGKKTPVMMYQMNKNKKTKRNEDENPW